MPAPAFVSSNPVSGATAVPKNSTIQVVFDTALAPATISSRTVILRNTVLGQIEPASVSLSADGLTITIVPNSLLFPGTAYELRLVGQDISTTVRITSTGSNPLAVSLKIAFQTGDSLQANSDAGTKAEPETDLEGGAVLPTDIGFRATAGAPLRLLQSNPRHHFFGIPTDTTGLLLRFSSRIDESTVPDNVSVSFSTFYDEDEFRAVKTDIGNGDGERDYFRYETGYYNSSAIGFLDPNLFADPIATVTVEGSYLHIGIAPLTGNVLPNNLLIQVDIDSIEDESGNLPSQPYTYIVCTEPYPKWVSPQAVRHEIGSFASAETPEDFIGLRIWQASMDLWMRLLRYPNLLSPNRSYQIYVRLRSALDVFDDLMATKYLNSGVVKELGDLRIQYNTGAGGARPRKVKELEERLAKLEFALRAMWTQTPRTGIRSAADPLEPSRGYFRQRLWKAELMENRGPGGLTGKLAAHTAQERQPRGPGMLGSTMAINIVNAIEIG